MLGDLFRLQPSETSSKPLSATLQFYNLENVDNIYIRDKIVP